MKKVPHDKVDQYLHKDIIGVLSTDAFVILFEKGDEDTPEWVDLQTRALQGEEQPDQ